MGGLPTQEAKSKWFPDDKVPDNTCMVDGCHTTFSVLTRKHHCRACGKVICAECSKRKIQMYPVGGSKTSVTKKLKVCKQCVEKYQPPSSYKEWQRLHPLLDDDPLTTKVFGQNFLTTFELEK